MIRAAGICTHDRAETVLAHVRIVGISGMSMKAPDWFAAWACNACHDYVDGRSHKHVVYPKRRQDHLEGMVRTQHELLARGHIPEAERLT